MGVVGRWLSIKSYKHNGTLHRYWDRAFVIENNHDFIVTASRRAKVVESNGRRWFTKEPAVTIFSKKEWWNVICMLKDDGVSYYCNLASPSLLSGDAIKYIDYDLDTKLYAGGEIKLLDENEYKYHKQTYNYSDDLDKVLTYQMKEIVKMMKERKFPFDDAKIQEYFKTFLEMTGKEK